MVGGGLFPSPPVTKKSPTPTEKSPTVISKRCWTLEYSGELEFSSPFMEQWTLDARGVLTVKAIDDCDILEDELTLHLDRLTKRRVCFTYVDIGLKNSIGYFGRR